MAMAMVRAAGLRTALRGGSAPPKRSFSSSAGHNDAREADKWEKITYLGIAACTILTFVNLSKPHPHHEPPPPYPYLHIRNKEFPWGPDGLFRKKARPLGWHLGHFKKGPFGITLVHVHVRRMH